MLGLMRCKSIGYMQSRKQQGRVGPADRIIFAQWPGHRCDIGLKVPLFFASRNPHGHFLSRIKTFSLDSIVSTQSVYGRLVFPKTIDSRGRHVKGGLDSMRGRGESGCLDLSHSLWGRKHGEHGDREHWLEAGVDLLVVPPIRGA